MNITAMDFPLSLYAITICIFLTGVRTSICARMPMCLDRLFIVHSSAQFTIRSDQLISNNHPQKENYQRNISKQKMGAFANLIGKCTGNFVENILGYAKIKSKRTISAL